MTCNLSRYLEEQERTCRFIAKSANDGTQAQQEWLRVAELLSQCRKDHVRICQKCSAPASI